jgi:hypothetical protein
MLMPHTYDESGRSGGICLNVAIPWLYLVTWAWLILTARLKLADINQLAQGRLQITVQSDSRAKLSLTSQLGPVILLQAALIFGNFPISPLN